jgi:membrane-bound lytic murein transglycosylase MltF
MLAAQGFQESGLDQSARGPTGAVGVMQIMPATGASLKVGDITITQHNIHAGAKYMHELATKYFADPAIDKLNRTLFCFAAYNAGPARLASLRKTAAARQLDPNQWFNHVELVTAEKVGRETTTYVRNIYKYYVSYTLGLELDARTREARDTLPAKHDKTPSD